LVGTGPDGLIRRASPNIVVKAAHSVGKTRGLSRLVLWWISVHPISDALVVITSDNDDNIKAGIFQELIAAKQAAEEAGRPFRERSRGMRSGMPGRTNQTLIIFGCKPSDRNPTGLQGYHRKCLLVLIDECAGVPAELWEAAESLALNAAGVVCPPETRLILHRTLPTPAPTRTPAPGPSIPPLDSRFELVKLTTFDGVSLPPDFYAYARSRGNEGIGYRDQSKVSVKDGKLIITATGDTSGAVGQNVKQQYGFWEIHAMFEKGQGYKPCILLWPGTEKDSAGIQLGHSKSNTTWWRRTASATAASAMFTTASRTPRPGRTNSLVTSASGTRTDVSCIRWSEVYLDGKVIKELTQDYVRSKYPHRLGIQLDVGSGTRVNRDVRMFVDWVRVARLK
jgi:hypothetical protein